MPPAHPPGRGPIHLLALCLFLIALPIALLTANIRVAFNAPSLYDYSVRKYDAPALAGVPKEELLRANRELIRYFNDDRTVFSLMVRDGQGNIVPLFSPQETAHLADVKALLRRLYAVQEGALAYVLMFVVGVVVWAREISVRQLAWAIMASTALTILIAGLIAVTALVGFDSAWAALHQALFNNDLWRLDPTRHHLVQMFPEEFWLEMVLLIGLATAVQMLVLALAAGAFLAWRRRPSVVAVEGKAGLPLHKLQERPSG